MGTLVCTLTHKFDDWGGRFSILSMPGRTIDDIWIMEREWKNNQPSISCVPRDEYSIEKHNGVKYTGTFAVIGDGVSHFRDDGKPRFSCVFHKAVLPSDLAGCLAPARSISAGGIAVGSEDATLALLKAWNDHDGSIKLLCQ